MVYLFVGFGGVLGSVLRYLISLLTLPTIVHFPIGTLLVNLLGSFLLGWFTSRIMPIRKLSLELKTGITTGVIGSFTTFSTINVEVIEMIRSSYYFELLLYLGISVFGGVSLVYLGLNMRMNGVNEAEK